MTITKVRQMVIHANPLSGLKPIFDHVDCEKLPKNPEAGNDRTTSVAGGNLLAAMFGTADEEEEDVQGNFFALFFMNLFFDELFLMNFFDELFC